MKRLVVIIVLLFPLFGVFGLKNMNAQVGVNVTIAPPALPVYEQPPCPADGYLWSPGYWAYGPDGYYWVPGVWVAPPEVGLLWTPGYWGFIDGGYLWYAGYWGPTIGFYGGVCYGWGYGGHGFYGGKWEGGHFMYNTAAWHVNNTVIHNTYVDKTVINNSGSRTSFNGRGGVNAQPTASEQATRNEKHVGPTSTQRANEHTASTNKSQLASVNKGRPGTTTRSTVGGQRFSSSGLSINNSGHSTSSSPASNTHASSSSAHTASNTSHTTQPAHNVSIASKPAAHATNNAPKSAHTNSTSRPQPQAHPAQQSRPAPQPQHNNVQRAAPPPREAAPPPRMGSGGRSMGGGGGGRKH